MIGEGYPEEGNDAMPGPAGWWKAFFAGDHVRFQIDLSEEAHDSDAETRLLRQLADIAAGTRVLDVPCGQGRHAVRFAEAGAIVTGVDASREMLWSAERGAADRGVRICWVHADMREIRWASEFDCALCLGGSFGYFGADQDCAFLRSIRRALRPGGRFVLDVPSLEFISANHRPIDRTSVGGRTVVQHRSLDLDSSVASNRITIQTPHGPVTRVYYQRLYTSGELRGLLAAAGFTEIEFLDAADAPEYRSNRGHVLLFAK